MKFDFLGLTTLTILDWTVRYISANVSKRRSTRRSPDPHLFLENLPLDDPATYALLRQGNAVGVFQFESRGMKDLVEEGEARPL